MDLLPAWRAMVFLGGLTLAWFTIVSAVRTFVLPRGEPDSLTTRVFRLSRLVFDFRLHRVREYEQRDRVMAFYAPATLLILPVVWLARIIVAYTAMLWAAGAGDVLTAFHISGSSVLTLGFAVGHNELSILLTLSEAAIGLLLVALLIAYLPAMYAAWATREAGVALLEVWAGPGASPLRILLRFHGIGADGRYSDLWVNWITWFTHIGESHTSLSPLIFFRGPRPHRHWVRAAGAVLDMAALVHSTLDVPPDPQVAVCIRSGYLSLRDIADLFDLPYPPDPSPGDPISVPRAWFDKAYHLLEELGVPVKPDREQCWRDYAGWRVTYDAPLVALSELTVAPPEDWFVRLRKRVDAPDGVDEVEAASGEQVVPAG